MSKVFLSAEWRKLIMANYVVDPKILLPYLPYGTELDFWNGHCFVSLVGFMFKETRVLGVKIPWHVNFEEVNLRFYVRVSTKDGWRRGTVFIKEIVPRAAISFVANTLYGEHYATMPMRHTWEKDAEKQNIGYFWKKKGVWNSLEVQASLQPQAIEAGSEAEFIAEHYWGYTKLSDTKTSEYEVGHPRWEVYPVRAYTIEADFGGLYGSDFSGLKETKPSSVFLAEGSEIMVFGKTKE